MALVTKENFGEMLIEAAKEMVAVHRGELEPARVVRRPITRRVATVASPSHYTAEQIQAIRERMGVSQPVFAKLINASTSTVKAWEQGLRAPEGTSLRLLEIADMHPEILTTLIEPTREPAQEPVREPARRKAS